MREEWIEIDHIVPLSEFELANKWELLASGHFYNLQPLWQADNKKKADRYNTGDKEALVKRVKAFYRAA